MTAWTGGFLTPQQADETIRLAKEAHLNALFIQVRKSGDAYYKSNYEPRATNIKAGYDPLEYIIEHAHAEGLEVHAWMNTFRIWTRCELPSDPSHIARRHPGWVTRTPAGIMKAGEGLFLDPGVPGVQDYTFNVFLDVVRNYDIDGIHFDYVRYPGPSFGYAPAAVAEFNLETGRSGMPSNNDSEWEQWRRDQVTSLVRRVYRAATAIKPHLKVTAATVPWGNCRGQFCDTSPFLQVYQDWRGWMEEGIIDANVPMNYKDERSTKMATYFRNWLDGFNRWRYDRHVYGGLNFMADPKLATRQIEACRKRGLQGMVGFQFNQSPGRLKLVRTLRNGIFADTASVPDMPWKGSAVASAGATSNSFDRAQRTRTE